MNSTNTALFDDKLNREKTYWLEKFAGEPRAAGIPLDRKRPAVFNRVRSSVTIQIDPETEARLREVCGNKEALMFTLLVTALKICLHKYTGETDVIVGTAIHERFAEVASLNKVLALRDDVRPEKTIKQLLQAVKGTLSEAYANQKYPFERLVKLLNVENSSNRAPLINVVVILDTINNKENVRHLMSDATLVYSLGSGPVTCAIEYNPDLFESETIKIFGRHLQTILRAVLHEADAEVSQLELLSGEERHRLLVKFNDTQSEYRKHDTISRLFEEQVEQTPDRIAVTFGKRNVTYRELNVRADRLAHKLREEGIKPGALAGICLEHSIETVIAILGVLKAGGGYVPLDPRHPKGRLAFVLADASCGVLLTQQSLLDVLPDNDSKVICLDSEWEIIARESAEDPAVEVSAEDLAYVIYTSGSTGDPKGVAVNHRSLVNYAQWASRVYIRNETLAFPLYSSLAFDLTVTSIYTPLITGNRIIVYRQEGRDPALFDILRDNDVGVLKLTPSHLALIKDDDHRTSKIKRLIVGGEAFDTETARQIHESFGGAVEIFNEYGPTEATVGCMLHKYDPESDRRAFVPIGKPAANTQIYILDENLKPVAENVLGDLYISGVGLAVGYFNKEKLTREKFVDHPFIPGEKMYKSGDLARWLPNGNIEYADRRDEQVKFHGFRVELNEIRSALNSHPQISKSITVVLKDKSDYDVMIAYYVSERELEPAQLHAFLSERLVQETIPNIFFHLQELPLTLNGKVDTRALPGLEEVRKKLKRNFVAARNPVEEMLAESWAELLGIPKVSIHDNFFELGGHSLLATQLFSRIRQTLNLELPLRILFESPTIAEFAERLEAAKGSGLGTQAPPLRPVSRAAKFPLSFAQQRLWFIDQLVPGSTFYNVSSAVRLQGRLNIAALERTITEVARRHEVLRTTFPMVDGEPAQVFAPVQPFELPIKDLSDLTEQQREEELRKLLSEFSARPFNLSQDSLLRVRLVRLGEDSHAVMLVTHHIICDGWSMGVLVKEVVAIYGAFSRGEPSPLPELQIQYADFAVWQREWLQGETLEQQLSYWREQLRGAPPVLELPTDRPRPAVQSYRGASHSFRVSAEVNAELKTLSRTEGATLFMTLLAAFKVLLSRYSGQTDIVVGTPIAGRNRVELEPLIGFFVNTLAMRTRLSSALSFREVLREVRETALEAYAHENLPFEKIVEELNPERALSHTPLVQVVFGFQSLLDKATGESELTMSSLGNESGTARFDVVQNMFETEQGLSGSLHCNTDLFDLETIKRMSGHFQRLLHSIVERPDAAISQLALLSAEETHQQLVEWNDTETDFPGHLCFQQLFEQQVERTPEAIAVRCEDRSLTYRELNVRANRLAHLLVERGAAQEVVVALLAGRDLDLLVAVLAIFKAGAAYLPLDPGSPALRLAQVLDQSATPLVLATSEQQQLLEQTLAAVPESRRPAVLQIDDPIESDEERGQGLPSEVAAENLPLRNSPSSLAYVIYTSGSTGIPKGAMVEQRGMVNHLFAKVRDLALTPADKVAQTASQSFDISVWQMLAALVVGGQVEIFRDAVAHNARRLLVEAERVGVTILETVPSLLRAMLDEPESSRYLSALRWMVPTGEALPPELCRRWLTTFPNVPLLNAYGPTECSDDVSHHPIHFVAATEEHNVPIGRPIANLRLYILDHQLRAVPVGVRGELCVGGVGVGRGYLLTPGRTAEAFVPDVFGKEKGRRLYRTGDLARFLPNGNIEFLGRIDHQVKLRGFRIELGEIEVALRDSQEVIDAVVMVREDVAGSLRLVAYVVWAVEAGAQVERLQSRLKERLPEYMVPTAFVSLPAMPLTVNGKVDRRALPSPEQAGTELKHSFVAPRTPLERWLVEKWAAALNLEAGQVGVEDSFFDLGGESIKAAIIVNRVQDALGEVVHVVTILDAPTVAGFAAFLEGRYGPAISRLLGNADATVAAEPREVEAQEVVTESKVEQLRQLSAEARQRVAPLGGQESEKERRVAARWPVLFVLSPPRSGSTLLRVLLGGHSRLFAPPELELLGFRDMGQRRDALSGRDKFWLEGAIRAVMQARDCTADEAQAIIGEYEASSATTTAFYRDLQEWIGAGRMLVDKTPSYALELEVLRRAEQEFGREARYIHLVRRAEAVIHSYEEAHLEQIFPRFPHPFSGREVAELVWTISQQNILEFLGGVSSERQHRVVFEELVAEPRRVLEGVSEFLRLEYEAGMSEPYRERAERMTDGVWAESKMLGDVKFHEHRGIEANAGERWREAVAQGLEIGELTRELAKSLGYVAQPETNKLATIGALRKSLTPIKRVDEKANDEQIAADISVMSDQEVEAMLDSVLA